MSWYALDDPNDPQLDELARQFQLHPLHIEDCRSNNERLKAEGTDNYLFLILKYIQSVQDGDIGFANIYLFVGRDLHHQRPRPLLRKQRDSAARHEGGSRRETFQASLSDHRQHCRLLLCLHRPQR